MSLKSEATSSSDINLPSEGFTVKDGNARWTDERIGRLIREFGASNQDYSQAYAMLMNPRDYLQLSYGQKILHCIAKLTLSKSSFILIVGDVVALLVPGSFREPGVDLLLFLVLRSAKPRTATPC